MKITINPRSRLVLGVVGLLGLVVVLFIVHGVWDYTLPRRLFNKAENLQTQGRFKESIEVLQQALQEAPTLDYRNEMLEAMSRKFTSPAYYDFWESLYDSASQKDQKWPIYYVYMQEDSAFRGMFRCDSEAARKFGLDKLKDKSTPKLLRHTIKDMMGPDSY